MSELKKYLESIIAFRAASFPNGNPDLLYQGTEDLVLKHGSTWTGTERPADVDQGEMKMCFANAFWLADASSGELCYVEGYSITVIPMLHAWCVDRKRRVVDPTWKDDPDREYLGLPLDQSWLRRYVFKQEVYGVLDDWMNGWPLLRGTVKPVFANEFRS